MHVYIYMYVYEFVCVSIFYIYCVYVYIYIYTYVYSVYIYIVYVYNYIYICIWRERERRLLLLFGPVLPCFKVSTSSTETNDNVPGQHGVWKDLYKPKDSLHGLNLPLGDQWLIQLEAGHNEVSRIWIIYHSNQLDAPAGTLVESPLDLKNVWLTTSNQRFLAAREIWRKTKNIY